MKEAEIIYKRKGIKAPILWEKTYYCNDLIDESRTLKGEPTGQWSGIAFLYRFLILQGSKKCSCGCNQIRNRFMIEPLIEKYEGETEEKMVDNLQKKIKGMKEWVLKGKHWKEADFFPSEVNKKLLEFNLEKYVKKIS